MMGDLKQKDFDDLSGWQKHLRRTTQDENLSKNTRRKINYRIDLMDRFVNEIERLRARNEKLKNALATGIHGMENHGLSLTANYKLMRTTLADCEVDDD